MGWFGDAFNRVFANNGVPLPPRKTYNIVSGATATDNPSTGSTDLVITGGSASPGGAANDVQINSAGSFGADTGTFYYDLSAHTLVVGGVSVAASGEVKNSGDAKCAIDTLPVHLVTAAGALAIIRSFDLTAFTGTFTLVARVSVTGASGADVGTWLVDADFQVVAGTATLIFPASLASAVTSRGKTGTITGTEITVAITGAGGANHVEIQTTPPDGTSYTWCAHVMTQTGVA